MGDKYLRAGTEMEGTDVTEGDANGIGAADLEKLVSAKFGVVKDEMVSAKFDVAKDEMVSAKFGVAGYDGGKQDDSLSFESSVLRLLSAQNHAGLLEENKKNDSDEEEEEWSPLRKQLKQALDANGFDLRGSAVGKQWYRSLKKNRDLKEAYEKCQGRDAQKNFRQVWLKGFWNETKVTRNEKNSKEEYEVQAGDFVPIEKAIEDQGGSDEAKRGIFNFIQQAIQEKKIDKYIQFNKWTKRLEIAIPKRKWSDGHHLGL